MNGAIAAAAPRPGGPRPVRLRAIPVVARDAARRRLVQSPVPLPSRHVKDSLLGNVAREVIPCEDRSVGAGGFRRRPEHGAIDAPVEEVRRALCTDGRRRRHCEARGEEEHRPAAAETGGRGELFRDGDAPDTRLGDIGQGLERGLEHGAVDRSVQAHPPFLGTLERDGDEVHGAALRRDPELDGAPLVDDDGEAGPRLRVQRRDQRLRMARPRQVGLEVEPDVDAGAESRTSA